MKSAPIPHAPPAAPRCALRLARLCRLRGARRHGIVGDRARTPPRPTSPCAAMDGRTCASHEQRGRVVMVNFWATWCGPCRQEMPQLNRLYEKYQVSGFVLLGVNVDDDAHTATDRGGQAGRQLPGAARHRQDGEQAVRPEHDAVDGHHRPRRQDALSSTAATARARGRLRAADPGAAGMSATRRFAPSRRRRRLGARGSAAARCRCRAQPWVKPYERERLADPIMKISRDELPDKHATTSTRARGLARRHRRAGRRLWLQLGPRRPLAAPATLLGGLLGGARGAGGRPSTCPRTAPRR